MRLKLDSSRPPTQDQERRPTARHLKIIAPLGWFLAGCDPIHADADGCAQTEVKFIIPNAGDVLELRAFPCIESQSDGSVRVDVFQDVASADQAESTSAFDVVFDPPHDNVSFSTWSTTAIHCDDGIAIAILRTDDGPDVVTGKVVVDTVAIRSTSCSISMLPGNRP